MIGKWSVSSNGEDFWGEFDSRNEAVAEGIANDLEIFWVGRNRAPTPLSDGVDAEELISKAIENLEDDWCFDFVEFEPAESLLKELEQDIRSVVNHWVERHKLHPKWCIIEGSSVEKIYNNMGDEEE